MNKQMFVDESERNGLLILSGVIFDPQDVEPFSKAWNRLLPKGQRELGKNNQRRSPLVAGKLYRGSIRYVYGVFDLVIPLDDYKEELNTLLRDTIPFRNRILSVDPSHKELKPEVFERQLRPRLVAYAAFFSFFEQILLKFGLAEPVDVTFDKYGKPKLQQDVREGYEIHREAVPPDQSLVMGEPPTFVNSQDCAPIQLADLWAFWRGDAVSKNRKLDVAQNPIPWSEVDDIRNRNMVGLYWGQTDINASFMQILGRLDDRRSRIIRPF